MIETDLFEFAYVPDWYGQLEQLAEMALPEAWRFRKPQTECKNTDTPILERYLHMMFRKLSIDYNTGETEYFHVENGCFFQAAICRAAAQKAIFPDDAKWCKLQSGMANSGKCRTHSQRPGKSGTAAKEAASV